MPVNLPDLIAADKTLATRPQWTLRDGLRLTIAVGLDIDGITMEGLELHASCIEACPDRAVCLHLQYHPARQPCTPLARAEWRPLSPHTNPNCGPIGLRLQIIAGSHLHRFDLNYLRAEARMREGNLPVAEPIEPDPRNLDAFLDIVGREFRIRGLNGIGTPPWQMGKLFS